MLEQDYFMRKIKSMIRAMLKILFEIEDDNISVELLDNDKDIEKLNMLIEEIDNGDINNAENDLYDYIDTENMDNLKMAIVFYSYLNDKDSSFLKKNNYRREEIRQGLRDLLYEYGLEGMENVFLINR